MKINPLFAIDGYKTGHRQQYPMGTELVYGNFTPRTNKHFKSPFFSFRKGGSPLIWAGMQAFALQWLQETFNENFFSQPKDRMVNEFVAFMDSYIGKGAVPADGVAALHDLGYLPIEIKAIPEGCYVDMKVPVFTIVNTQSEFFWLVNYLETLLSAELWPVATAATIAFNYRCIGEYWSVKTCDTADHLDWQFHDFSARGDMGMWANTLVGLGHLFSFTGTDSVLALRRLQLQYEVDCLDGMSVNATEHSVMCMGEKVSEIETFRRLITETYPEGIVSIVSDTWDYWKVVCEMLPQLKDTITKRNGKVVIRPDSGDPVDIICGERFLDLDELAHLGDALVYMRKAKADGLVCRYRNEYYRLVKDGFVAVPEHVIKGSIQMFWEIFGGTVNGKGFKVLHPSIGLIYGDSITMDRADEIFDRLSEKNFASSNVVLGIGSYTYQYVTRDTFGFAMKATYGVVNGEPREIFKDPATDDGTKKSLKGLMFHSLSDSGVWSVKDQATPEEEQETQLTTIYKDGKILCFDTVSEIRNRIKYAVATFVKAKLSNDNKTKVKSNG